MDKIVPGNFNGAGYTDLLFYDDSTGEAFFYSVSGGGLSSIIKSYSDWSKDWSNIIPGDYGLTNITDLLLYK